MQSRDALGFLQMMVLMGKSKWDPRISYHQEFLVPLFIPSSTLTPRSFCKWRRAGCAANINELTPLKHHITAINFNYCSLICPQLSRTSPSRAAAAAAVGKYRQLFAFMLSAASPSSSVPSRLSLLAEEETHSPVRTKRLRAAVWRHR